MKKNSNKYVVTIRKKNNLGENCFLVSYDHVSLGDINKETQIFTDEEGNSFSPLDNPYMIASEVPFIYDSVIPLENLKTIAKNSQLSLKNALVEYEREVKKTLYLVGKTEEGQTFKTTLNMDEIKGDLNQRDDQNFEESEEKMNPETKEITIDNLEELIIDISEGKYTDEQLQSILEELELTSEDIKDVIEFVKSNMKNLPQEEQEYVKPTVDIKKVFNEVVKTLIGQNEACLKLIVEIARKEMDSREKRQGILLTGNVGVGKTELMRLIEKNTEIPVYRIDSNELTVPGGYPNGKTIEEELWNLYKKCGNNKKTVENAILFFDGVDSWLSREEECHPDVIRIPLNIMDGKTYSICSDVTKLQKPVEINTENMTVILGGSYTNKSNFGFLQKNKDGVASEISIKDFIEKGQIPREYMGRLSVIKLNSLDSETIQRILLESDESPTKIQEAIFEKLGVKITFTNGYVKEVADRVMEEEIGARGLNNTVSNSTWKALYEVQSNPETYEEVIMNEESVKNSNNYQLIKKRK